MNFQNITGRKLGRTNRLLVREAIERGVEIKVLPRKRFRMYKDNKQYLVRGGTVCHAYNPKMSIKLLKYKNATNNLLRSMGYSSPENAVFIKEEMERAWNWAEPILPVVIKPNDGIQGRSVYVNIDNYEEFKDCFLRVAELRDHILIEKFVEGDEYRFTYLRNEIVAVTKRIPAHVNGNGTSTIKELIVSKNKERDARQNPIHKKLDTGEESRRVLKKQGFSLDYTPQKNEVVYLRNNSNISTGGDAIDVTHTMDQDMKETIRKAMYSISGLRVCGLDVIIKGDNYHIIEVNTNPMLSLHHYPWEGEAIDVTSKVIDAMFPDTVNEK